ncbi:MAG: hypothetical protein HQ463_00500, partial [Bacteroidetes bacterium]|nr:hypothetical protein [Bacteroidota bacterium]
MTKKILIFTLLLSFSLSNLKGQCSASFTFSNSKCYGDSVMFSFTGNGDSLFWNFNDISSGSYNLSSDSDVVHIFSTKGLFNVRLIVKDTNGCSDTVLHSLKIFNKPTSNFSIVNTCAGLLSEINNLSTSDTNNTINNYFYSCY